MPVLENIAAAAAAAGLDYLLIGGHAVIAHGFPRNTFDLDLLVRRSEAERWTTLAAAQGYAFEKQTDNFARYQRADGTDFPLDLMLVNESTFAKLQTQAQPVAYGPQSVPVVSLPHLIALKCHAIRHGRSDRKIKDTDDILRLVSLHRLDLRRPDLRELILHYGTPELYEKLENSTRPD